MVYFVLKVAETDTGIYSVTSPRKFIIHFTQSYLCTIGCALVFFSISVLSDHEPNVSIYALISITVHSILVAREAKGLQEVGKISDNILSRDINMRIFTD